MEQNGSVEFFLRFLRELSIFKTPSDPDLSSNILRIPRRKLQVYLDLELNSYGRSFG